MKYYKGLGTSTSKEAKEYFKNIEDHGLSFDWDDKAQESIDLAFNKKRADDRKYWITNHKEGDYVDHTLPSLTYSDFINKELVLFSKYDNHRMIPSMVDGLKPSQRKVLFSCIKRNLKKDVKVAQLSGYISEHAAYHHGEVSLQGAIVSMAQVGELLLLSRGYGGGEWWWVLVFVIFGRYLIWVLHFSENIVVFVT